MKRGRPPKGFVADSDLPILLEYWEKAAAMQFGMAIASKRPNILAQKLYRARRECGHNEYDHLKVVEMPEEVRIVPK